MNGRLPINAVVAGINVLLWGGLAWMGWGLLRGVEGRHVAGYPNRGQSIYYLHFPIAMAAFALALYAVAHFTRFRIPALLTQALVFFFLFLYMLAYTGGV